MLPVEQVNICVRITGLNINIALVYATSQLVVVSRFVSFETQRSKHAWEIDQSGFGNSLIFKDHSSVSKEIPFALDIELDARDEYFFHELHLFSLLTWSSCLIKW